MVRTTDTTPKKRPSNRATLEAKLAAMPFGGFRSDRVIPFRVGPLLRDQRWVKHPEDSGEAARQVGVAFSWYWMNSDSRFLPRDYSTVVEALSRHVPPLLQALDLASGKKSYSGIFYQIELFAQDGRDFMHDLHLALQRANKALEQIERSKKRQTAQRDGHSPPSASGPSVRKNAAKSVGKLYDPAGHKLALKLIEPYMLISGREPSGQPNSLFSQFIASAEELLILRIAQEMKRRQPSLTKANALAAAQMQYRIVDRAASVRWAVNEWKKRQET
jgi:hypothetical protein